MYCGDIYSDNTVPLHYDVFKWKHFPRYFPESKVHGANMGPIWGRQDPGGPHVVPWTLLSGWSFVMGIHRSPVDSLHKVQWREALSFSFTFAWTNSWANNRDAAVPIMTSLQWANRQSLLTPGMKQYNAVWNYWYPDVNQLNYDNNLDVLDE